MTTVDVVFRYQAQPNETVAAALANAREVYGIRRILFDQPSHTVRVEYDATRLNVGSVAKLLRSAGLQVTEEVPLTAPPPAPEPAPAA